MMSEDTQTILGSAAVALKVRKYRLNAQKLGCAKNFQKREV